MKLRKINILLACATGVFTACPTEQGPGLSIRATKAVTSKELDLTMNEIAQAANKLMTRLQGTLKSSIANVGSAGSIQICSEQAPQIAHTVFLETGVRVGRATLKKRNHENRPPQWVSDWLRQTNKDGSPPLAEDFRDEKNARYLRPIYIQQVCLKCHGSRQSMSLELRQKIRDIYPEDQATGYRLNDLRGVLWAELGKQPLKNKDSR